jgi:hypothetical protein
MEEPPHNSNQRTLFRAVAGTLLLIGFGVFYYLVIFLPHQASLKAQQEQAALEQKQQATEQQQQLQQQKLDQENQHKLDQAAALQDCLDIAGTTYQTNWATACTHYGVDTKGPDCLLPAYQVSLENGYYKDAKDLCLKQYPQQ